MEDFRLSYGVYKCFSIHIHVRGHSGRFNLEFTPHKVSIIFTPYPPGGHKQSDPILFIKGPTYDSPHLPSHLAHWKDRINLLSESYGSYGSGLAGQFLLDEIRIKTWVPGDDSFWEKTCPEIFYGLIEQFLESRLLTSWDKNRDAWMGDLFPDVYNRLTYAILRRDFERIKIIVSE